MDIDIKKRALSLLPFDLLKVLDLPFDVQIYARKTHAENVSVHKTMLEHQLILFKTCLGFPTNQDLAYNAIIYVCCLSVVLCHRRLVDLMFLIGQDWPIDYFYALTSWRGDGWLTNFACLQLRLEEGEDISGTLVIKCGIILQQALVCI